MGKPYTSEIHKLRSTYLWSLEVPIEGLKSFIEASYDLPLLAIGSGGSLSAAYMAALLHEKTGMVSESLTPLELLSTKIALRKTSILLLTAGGRNSDILTSFKYAAMSEPRQLMAVCTRPTSPLSKLATEFRYSRILEFDIPSGKDGFLATNSLIALSTLLCRAYQNIVPADNNLPNDLIPKEGFYSCFDEQNPLLLRNTWVVLYSSYSLPAAVDLESKCTEAALCHIQLADYRNFAHGRHYWLAKHAEHTGVVCLISPEEIDIAKRTIALIPKDIPLIQISTRYSGAVGALELLLKVLYFIKIVGDAKGIDPGKPNVPTFGRKLYHLNIPSNYIKGLVPQGLKKHEFTAIKRKIGESKFIMEKEINYWRKAYRAFVNKIGQAQFGSIVFDYDGTLCDPDERYSGPPQSIGNELIRLVNRNIIVGIATGRGKSVRIDMQRIIPEKYWEKIVIGYYNGSDIGILRDDKHPNKTVSPDIILEEICGMLDINELFKSVAEYELRPKQITVFPSKTFLWNDARKILLDIISKNGPSGIRILESSHSIDIISSDTSKLNLVSVVKEMSKELNKSKHILCIGDRGEWPGNDYELLSLPYSLSVDYVSPDSMTCWNLAPAGHRGVQATLDYFNAIEVKDKYFRFNNKLMEGT